MTRGEVIPLEDHKRLDLCDRPRPRMKYESRLWVCPRCGQAWIATTKLDPRHVPDGLSWRWRKWPLEDEEKLLADELREGPQKLVEDIRRGQPYLPDPP